MSKYKVTRRQAVQWLAPIRNAFAEMRTGEVDAIRGYPVTRLHDRDEYARLDYCIAGFRAMIARLWPHIDGTALERVERKLANGLPLTIGELNDCAITFRQTENALTGMDRRIVSAAVLTEQIAIEMENRRTA